MGNIKKFEDFLDKMQGLLDNAKKQGHIIVRVEDIENTFPELKESEDEKIRKGIIRNLEYLANRAEGFVKDDLKEKIAWLEKQSKSNLIEEIKRRKEILLHEKEKAVSFAEKLSLGGRIAILEELLVFADEKQGEQKLADKIEPKFHEGEWIVWQNKCYKVNYNGCGYELIDQDGLSTSLEYGTIDESAHLWDVTKDAKDGDVLICKGGLKYSNGIKYERICLFNNLDNAFFTLTKTSNFVEEYNIDVNIDYPDNTIPATKEQKEILFMAMKEAGYEWSDKDRKLIKIVK